MAQTPAEENRPSSEPPDGNRPAEPHDPQRHYPPPFFVGDARAPRFVYDGSFPWGPHHRAKLAEVRQIGDVVLLRYALSDRFGGMD